MHSFNIVDRQSYSKKVKFSVQQLNNTVKKLAVQDSQLKIKEDHAAAM